MLTMYSSVVSFFLSSFKGATGDELTEVPNKELQNKQESPPA